MSITLIAVVVVVLAGWRFPALVRWRRLEGPWRHWQRLGRRIGARGDGWAAVSWVLLPGLLALLLQGWLGAHGRALLLPWGVLMLFLCWGPRDLDADAAALAEAEDDEALRAAARGLGLSAQPSGSAAVVEALFRAGLARWFAPLFWFMVLGGAGAMLYRSVWLAGAGEPRRGSVLHTLLQWMHLPVAGLMTLSLAMVANFDAVLGAWRDWRSRPAADRPGGPLGFLDAAARSSVQCELQDQIEEDAERAEDAAASAESLAGVVAPPSDAVVPTMQTAVEDGMALLWRMLLLWIAALALAVLGGLAG